jgi:hypothetical protein
MDPMDRIIDWLSFLKKRFYYADGLIVLLCLLAVGYFFIISQLRPGLNSIISACGWASLKPYFFLTGLFISWLLGLAIWYWKRALPRFRKHELGIIFAPNFPQELEGEVQRLLAHLIQELKSKSFGNQFSIRALPPNRIITSPQEATAIIRKCGGAVAVWGLIDSQRGADGTRTGFSKISFTVLHPPIIADPNYHRRILTPLAGRKWHVDERNQIVDRRLIAENIAIVVRNLLGMALLVSRRFDDAVKVFLPLCAELHPIATPDSPVLVRQFYNDLKEDTAFCLRASTEVAYVGYLRTDRLFSIPSTTLEA